MFCCNSEKEFAAIFICLTLLATLSYVVSDIINADTLVKWNTYFDGATVWSHTVSHIGTCAVVCMRMTMCVSFNFDLASNKCEMKRDLLESYPSLGIMKQNSVYSRIQDWPKQLDPDCYPRPCAYDEVCIPKEISDLLYGKPRCLRTHGQSTLTGTTSAELSTSQSTSTDTASAELTSSSSSASATASTLSTSQLTSTTPSQSSPTTTQSVLDCLDTLVNYSGTVSVTNSGRTCQSWAEQAPHAHNAIDGDFPIDGSVEGASNYCREVDDVGRPWCYTTDPYVRWGYCTLSICQGVINDCGGNFTNSSGSLTYPATNHPLNIDCVWFIQAPTDHVIRYQVELMPMMNPDDCYKYYPLSSLSERKFFCAGQYKILIEETTSNWLSLYYYTDENAEALNFMIHYRAVNNTVETVDTCFPLLNPVNGNVDVLPETPVNGTANYSCDVCYSLSGDGLRTCQTNGSWDGTQPTCLLTPEFGNSCYYFFMTNETWQNASDRCKTLQNHTYLIELETSEENVYIVNRLNALQGASTESWWIGASDKRTEGQFVWESNTTAVNHTDWVPGQPNNLGDEDCVILYHSSNFQWADRHCTSRLFFICERNVWP